MIDILLATFQGEKYLAEQIESILAQTYSDWRLMIHDDGSSDGTIEIAKKYTLAYPLKIVLLQDGVRTGSAKNNFSHLLAMSTAEYVMFCDQDDVWLQTKLETFQREMSRLEGASDKSTPIVVFSDVHIVAQDLTLISSSGWKFLRNGPQFAKSVDLLASRNCILGCAMMVNRAGVAVSSPIPQQAVMHDWWIGLSTLKKHGKLVAIVEPTVLYRQHESNVVGARQYDRLYQFQRLLKPIDLISDFIKVYTMAKYIGVSSNFLHFLYIKILAHEKI